MPKTKRVIITGGPGTGKTTIIKLLESHGFPCHKEAARAVIKVQLEKDSDLLPWKNLEKFSDEVFSQQQLQYGQAVPNICNFYDRGMPDVIAYLRRDDIASPHLDEVVPAYPYYKEVFVTPPWEDIYKKDNERREDFKTMVEIHQSLIKTYGSFGYNVIEVPFVRAKKRMEFVLERLQLL